MSFISFYLHLSPFIYKASKLAKVELQFCILSLGIETRTRLMDVGQVAVTEDHGIRIVHLQRLQQVIQGRFLFRGTGIGGNALGRQPTFIAHPDGVLVIVAGMCPRQILVACLIQLSVAGDVVVVAGKPEAGIVACDEVLDGEPTVTARGAAVDNNQIY